MCRPLVISTKARLSASWFLRHAGGDGQLYPLDVTMKGEEDITVPAGKFRARHIEIRGASQTMGIQGGGSQSHGGSGILRVNVDIWYVPGIKRFVKYVGDST